MSAMWGIGRPLLFVEPLAATCHADPKRGQEWAKLKDGTEFSWDPPELQRWALPGGEGVPPGAPSNGRRASGETQRQDDTAPIPCPCCGGPVWDNRFRKPANRANAADLRCKARRDCGWAVTVDGWERDIQARVAELQRARTITPEHAARAIAAAASRDPEQLHAVECWLVVEEKGGEAHA